MMQVKFEDNTITADTIVDLLGTACPYRAKFFYLWLCLEIGFDREFTLKDCMEYGGLCRRQIQRYLAQLEEAGLIYRAHKSNGAWGNSFYTKLTPIDE